LVSKLLSKNGKWLALASLKSIEIELNIKKNKNRYLVSESYLSYLSKYNFLYLNL
jgi:hypothetical protein